MNQFRLEQKVLFKGRCLEGKIGRYGLAGCWDTEGAILEEVILLKLF